MTREEVDKEFEIVWNGGEGLIGNRDTKPSTLWTPPKKGESNERDDEKD